MLRLLLVGDPHFRGGNARETDRMGKEVLRLVEELRPRAVVVLGDTLHTFGRISVYPLVRAVDFLLALSRKVFTVLLVGNHDRPNNSDFQSRYHPFTALEGRENLLVVGRTAGFSLDDLYFVAVPYVPPGRLEEALEGEPNWRSAAVIFAHQEIRGSRMGSVVSTRGDVWPPDAPLLVSGHIHEFQAADNVLYVGTPYQSDFGEREEKGLVLLSFSDESVRWERIQIAVPRKVVYELSWEQVPTFSLPFSDDEVKIVITGAPAEIRAVCKHPNYLAWKRDGVRLAYRCRPASSVALPRLERARYGEALRRAASSSPELGALLGELFG